MAGESPDKSDKKSGKEQSSGETARTERDPRLAVLRDERGERDGAGDTGKSGGGKGAAEAAADGTGDGSVDGSRNGSAKGAEGGTAGGSSKGAAKGTANGAVKGAAKGAVKGAVKGAGAAKDSAEAGAKDSVGNSAGDAVDSGEDAADSGKSSGKGSEERSGKDGSEVENKAENKAEDTAEDKAETGAAKKAGKAPEGSQRAAQGDAEGEAEASASAKPAGKAESAGKPAEVEAKAVDQATAVFKTVEPEKAGEPKKADESKKADAESGKGGSAEEAPADDATRVFAVAKIGKSGASGKGAAERPVDQPTAVFKFGKDAGGKDAEAKGAEAKDADGKAGESDKAGKSDKAEGGGAKEKGAAAAGAAADERDAERTSQFVALKSSDDGSAERSIGKTAPRTPLRKPGSADEAEKGQEKDGEQAAGAAKGAASAGAAAKASEKAPEKAKAPERAPEKAGEKASDKAGDKTSDKAAGKAPGAMPPAAPPKPARKPDAGAATASAAGAADEAGASAAEAESERTRQEPLPPLDLLAKLTNTPPPPETKLRSVVRRFKIWTPLAVLLAIIFAVVQAVRPLPAPTLVLGSAQSSFTFAGDKLSIPWPAQGQAAVKVVGSGEVGTFGEQKPVPTASVAKIMTAYVILKEHPLKKNEKGPQIEVDGKAVAEGNSESESRIAGLKAGQKFSEQDMLKMLMIPSGNNIARLLARWDTQSDNEAAFVKKMNAAAKDLGMTNTTYTDPSGLDAKTVSTAVDQIKLAEAVMKFDAFRPIVALPNAEIPGLPERINNNNDNLLLAGMSIKGIKTGSSTAAGGTLSWAAYKTVDGKDRLILGTMMDQHFKGLDPNASNSLTMVKDNSKKVIETVRGALTSATAVKKGQVVGYVDDGLGGLTPVVATKDLSAVGVPGQKLELNVGSGTAVPHEAKAGTVVGELTAGNGASQQKVPVALQADLAKPSFGAKLTRLG
ncbi:D-alanyl-D-alanine carboxypeptidase [Streptomyces sp. NPDC020883]|uniref:D-alanyl-D-alanine carboxypeptidase n=1 Tax=Streptomyces sp. NPDC020883 TaxID=3365099 RepID=UPI0037AD7318